jgi:predicted protein tyrosine phosphatase
MSISLAVCGFHEVPLFANSGITDIISIGDVGMPWPAFHRFEPPPQFHRFEFSDICHVASPSEKDVSPSLAHVEQLITLFDSFLARPHSSNLLFHCTAGRSRSPAAAFIFCVRAGKSYQEAYELVEKMRGRIAPNILMVKYADIAMNQGGKMLDWAASYSQDAQAWVKQNPL